MISGSQYYFAGRNKTNKTTIIINFNVLFYKTNLYIFTLDINVL